MVRQVLPTQYRAVKLMALDEGFRYIQRPGCLPFDYPQQDKAGKLRAGRSPLTLPGQEARFGQIEFAFQLAKQIITDAALIAEPDRCLPFDL